MVDIIEVDSMLHCVQHCPAGKIGQESEGLLVHLKNLFTHLTFTD